MADRGVEQFDAVKMRKYCSCMYEIFADNQPLTLTELERVYPPANAMCVEESGVLRVPGLGFRRNHVLGRLLSPLRKSRLQSSHLVR